MGVTKIHIIGCIRPGLYRIGVPSISAFASGGQVLRDVRDIGIDSDGGERKEVQGIVIFRSCLSDTAARVDRYMRGYECINLNMHVELSASLETHICKGSKTEI